MNIYLYVDLGLCYYCSLTDQPLIQSSISITQWTTHNMVKTCCEIFSKPAILKVDSDFRHSSYTHQPVMSEKYLYYLFPNHLQLHFSIFQSSHCTVWKAFFKICIRQLLEWCNCVSFFGIILLLDFKFIQSWSIEKIKRNP